MKHPNDAERIAGSRVTKLGRGEGQQVQLGNTGFTWKARGKDTGYQVSMYEMTLAPQSGIPLHQHPFPECFYVLEGQIDFARLTSEGAQEWVPCGAGESVVASPNAPHTFFNHSDQPAKFLSFSNYQHEVIFKDFEVDKIDLQHHPIRSNLLTSARSHSKTRVTPWNRKLVTTINGEEMAAMSCHRPLPAGHSCAVLQGNPAVPSPTVRVIVNYVASK